MDQFPIPTLELSLKFKGCQVVMKFLVIILLIINYTFELEYVQYDDYTVYKVTPRSEQEVTKLRHFHDTKSEFGFWTHVKSVGVPVDIMVSPQTNKEFKNVMDDLNIHYEIKLENVQQYIDKQGFRPDYKDGSFGWDDYYNLEEIYDWLNSVQNKYSDKVTIFTAGQTFENRTILGAKVSFSDNNKNNGVFLEANCHGRDWLTNAVSTFLLNQVLTNTDSDVRKVVESFDWYVVPVTNPDGFNYSIYTDRLWRKTRQPHWYCVGADPNRNWDYRWNRGGGDSNYCQPTYLGPNPFSEPETKTLSEFISTIGEKLKVYISFHSYGQYILIPYGFTPDHMDNYNVTYEVGLKAADALAKSYGTQYTVGNIAELIHLASGNSIDWVKGRHHVPYVFDYELRDKGENGYLVPAEQIIPTGEETWASLIVILKEALSNPDGLKTMK